MLKALRLYELFKYRAIHKYILLILFKLQILQRGNQASYLSLHFLRDAHIASELRTQT